MQYLLVLISLAVVLQAGKSHPSHYESAGHGPVGYHGPLAKTVVLKSGHIADTPEVSHAKHLHYSALQKAKASGGAYASSGAGYEGGSHGSSAGHGPVGYHGPLAKTVVLKSGHIADTPEVSHAKHLHYSAVQKAKASASVHGSSGAHYDESYGSSSGYDGSYTSGAKYSGPLAYPKVLASGQLADTHEVAAARHEHLNALAHTASEHSADWAGNDSH